MANKFSLATASATNQTDIISLMNEEMTKDSKVALVVGGSGMLAALSEILANKFRVVGVLGRTTAKMSELVKLDSVVPLLVDYQDSATLNRELDLFAKTYGKADLIVTWVHSTAPDATNIVAEYGKGDFYELVGHDRANNHHSSCKHGKPIQSKKITYHKITLGQIDGRWLTNQEISEGVYEAIQSNLLEFKIGN